MVHRFPYFAFLLLIVSSVMALSFNKGRECTGLGFMCEDCSISSFCYQHLNGTLIKDVVENCTQIQQTCREANGTCTSDVNEPCTSPLEFKFQCTQVGTFPDPYECGKYHMCVPAAEDADTDAVVGYAVTCPSGLWVDPLTLTCSVEARGECVPLIPKCVNASRGPVRGNPDMYYACLPTTAAGGNRAFAPAMYRCAGGHRYMKGECGDLAVAFGVNADGACTHAGNLYTPTCSEFNHCSQVGAQPRLVKCSADAYLNTTYEGCQSFKCASLRPQ